MMTKSPRLFRVRIGKVDSIECYLRGSSTIKVKGACWWLVVWPRHDRTSNVQLRTSKYGPSTDRGTLTTLGFHVALKV